MTELNLMLTVQSLENDDFQILAISQGEAKGHGIRFGSDVLRASLPLWDGIPTFLDHPSGNGQPSVRNLAGTLYQPVWDNEEQGIRLTLRPSGPAAETLRQLRLAVKSDPVIMRTVGFSASLTAHTRKTGEVTQVTAVHSVDVVINPARGGKFLTARPAQKGDNFMSDPETTAALPDEQEAAALSLQGAQEKIEHIENQAKQSNAVLLQMCIDLLSSGLAASRLPEPSQAVIRKRFLALVDAGTPFQPTDLQAAITEKREELAALTNVTLVQGPGRISGMTTTEDQVRAAVEDMFGIPRSEGLEKVNPARLSGIREMYHLLTGDFDMHGGYYPDRINLAVTTDFAGLVKNALNKLVVQGWDAMGIAGYDWWQKICSIQHFNTLNSITGILVGTIASLPSVAEAAEYTELVAGDSPETASFTKYGGYFPITLELIDRDETRKIMYMGRELGKSAMRNISEQVAYIFSQASGLGPTMADTGTLFNATAVTTAGGHANYLTAALSSAQWETVAAAIFNQPMLVHNSIGYYGTGKKQAIDPKFCLVPRALRQTANDIFLNPWLTTDNKHSSNLLVNTVQPLVVPEWTDATDWAAACDPNIAPSIILGERFGLQPEIYIAGNETDPSVFDNDTHRIKVRHFLALAVADFRPLHKSVVAG